MCPPSTNTECSSGESGSGGDARDFHRAGVNLIHKFHWVIFRPNTRWHATPLFITLLYVETTDLIFALDSIPTILGITLDPFIVYMSNVFAILGLQALYFALARVMRLFHYLRYGLAIVVAFVGTKTLISDVVTIPLGISFSVTASVLAISIVGSILIPQKAEIASAVDYTLRDQRQ